MTYEELDRLREMSDADSEAAEELTAAIEAELEARPFKQMPRSMRFLGAGFGCMEIFCSEGRFTVVRNNGSGLDIVLEGGDADTTKSQLLALIYNGRER